MKRFILTILLAGIFLALCQPAFAAQSYEPSENELLLIRLVNEARKDPRLAAERLGLDVDKITAGQPGMKKIFESRQPLIFFDQRLGRAAKNRAEELGDKLSKNGSFEDSDACFSSAELSGYDAFLCHDDTGFILFDSLLDQEQAVRTMFEFALMDEITRADPDTLRILDPNIRDGGAGLVSAALAHDSRKVNGYVFVLFLGGDRLLELETSHFELMNLARQYPVLALEAAGIDPDEAAQKLDDMSWVLEGLDPVGLSAGLSNFCRIDFYYPQQDCPRLFSDDLLDGTQFDTPKDIRGYRHDLEQAGPDPFDLFLDMVRAEIKYSHSAGLLLFNPDVSRVGIGVYERFDDHADLMDIVFCSVRD